MQNFLELIPEKLVNYQQEEDGRITLLLPKFRNNFFQKIFISDRKSKNTKIHLDENGSFVWKKIDNKKTVGEIISDAEAELGEKIAPATDRICLFLKQIYQHKFINLKNLQL